MNAAEQKMIDISQEISRINALASADSLIISGSSPGTGAERDQIVTGLVETIERTVSSVFERLAGQYFERKV